jgi:UDP-N-acetylmuramoylalanine--D-glutamate ligase
MILIYWKWKVGSAVVELARYLKIDFTVCDDTDVPDTYDAYEAIVPSPGIPGTHAIYSTGKVVSELDFAYRYLPQGFRIISITGTDGKSTTSWIMYNILEKEYSVNKSVYLSGNFDVPFSTTVLDILKKWKKRGHIVLEVSSFMSHILREFQSEYSIFTNFKVDHQNWHRNMQEYLDAKMHIIERTTRTAVINSQVLDFAHEHGLQANTPVSVRLYQSWKKDRTDGEDIIISGRKKYKLSETQLSWMHNALNILSCALVASEMKICSKRIKKYISEISGLPHRLEKIWEKNGIIFVEDSKSTSSQSLEAALGSYGDTRNLLLIVWGSDKGDSFINLAPKFQERVKAMVCIGATKQQFIDIAIQGHIVYRATDSMREAVEWLYNQGSMNDILILSPGCASFGLFKDYLDRANQFRDCIKNLP